MRLLECLLLLANLLAVLALLFTWPRQGRWLRQVVFIPVMLAGAHVLVEGPRWQMAPAYALTGLILLVWAWRRIVPRSGELLASYSTHRLARGWAIGLSSMGVVASSWLPVTFPVFRFPVPHGPYGIGTVSYHWVDARRRLVGGRHSVAADQHAGSLSAPARSRLHRSDSRHVSQQLYGPADLDATGFLAWVDRPN